MRYQGTDSRRSSRRTAADVVAPPLGPPSVESVRHRQQAAAAKRAAAAADMDALAARTVVGDHVDGGERLDALRRLREADERLAVTTDRLEAVELLQVVVADVAGTEALQQQRLRPLEAALRAARRAGVPFVLALVRVEHSAHACSGGGGPPRQASCVPVVRALAVALRPDDLVVLLEAGEDADELVCGLTGTTVGEAVGRLADLPGLLGEARSTTSSIGLATAGPHETVASLLFRARADVSDLEQRQGGTGS
ncbi:MAG: hypothetical protein JWN17_1770 [Frankiales bacterium]|nr:hypothetical protein [Frankiales bacterium]